MSSKEGVIGLFLSSLRIAFLFYLHPFWECASRSILVFFKRTFFNVFGIRFFIPAASMF